MYYFDFFGQRLPVRANFLKIILQKLYKGRRGGWSEIKALAESPAGQLPKLLKVA